LLESFVSHAKSREISEDGLSTQLCEIKSACLQRGGLALFSPAFSHVRQLEGEKNKEACQNLHGRWEESRQASVDKNESISLAKATFCNFAFVKAVINSL
jgi:hypothetical protein